MTISSLDELNEVHIDFLNEIANISSGNSVTSLSSMLDKKINMNSPAAKIVSISNANNLLGGPENVVVGVLAKLSQDFEGMTMLLFQVNFIKILIKYILNEEVDITNLSEMQKSLIAEIGNIMISSYVGAISAISGMNINISVPAISVDMAGAMITVPVIECGSLDDDIIFLEGDLFFDGEVVKSNLLTFPTIGSLNKLISRFGIVDGQ